MAEMALEEILESRRSEIATKLGVVRDLLAEARIDALHLTATANTAWLTAGAATYVDESVDQAACSALVTPSEAFLLTDPIEAPRLRDEERLDDLGWTIIEEPWHSRGPALEQLTTGLRVATEHQTAADDVTFWTALRWRRATLCAGEQARLRAGARLAAAAMDEVARALRRGMTERAVAGQLAAACRARGATAIVTLVGGDERILRYRHPLATGHPIERYAMLVLCSRYRGLVTALTRSVYFGQLPSDLLNTAQAVARIDARMLAETAPGRTLAEMFALARGAYADAGRPQAIEEHHQGGPIGYLSREALATPANEWRLATGQAFAWNPSLRGAKSEDTIVLTERGVEVVSAIEGWPAWDIETPGGAFARPAILEINL
jgi:Xaa-Pro aminopeptidase